MYNVAGDPPYQVGITFQGATVNIDGSSIETQLSSKAEKSHTHDIKDLNDTTNKLTSLTSDCIKKETSSENATIAGTFTCKDVKFTYNSTQTLLSTKMTEMDSMKSMTIQHLTLTSDPNMKVGSPVFFTGEIVGKNFSPITLSSTDCVPIVKTTGDWTQFAGICTEVDVSNYGKTTQKYKGIEHAYIRFATHGDFQMAVEDSSKYKVGDLITYDGSIVDTSAPLDYKTMFSIVGSVSAIVNNNSVAIFRI